MGKNKQKDWQSKHSLVGYDKGKGLGKDIEIRSKINPTGHAPRKNELE
jgi:hypothetical protein